jgi:Leucine-rich repeat (LRR) protein
MEVIGKSLEIFVCNGNHIDDISELTNLKILTTLEFKNNNLKEVNNIADVLTAMFRIKSITMLGNPIVKAPKYRDYSVILSKSLCIASFLI